MFESLTHLDELGSQQWITSQEMIETMMLVELIVSQETRFDYCTKGDITNYD